MKTLVIGGTGTVGSQVVRELRARDVGVTVLARNPGKAPLPDGVEAVAGDLTDPNTVRSIFHDMDSVFLLNPVSATEAQEGLMAVTGARAARVGHVVYLSVHNLDRAPYLPHFGAKVAVEAALRKSGLSHTVLRPNNYYQNDSWYRDVLLGHGVYPQPIGSVGVSRVDVRDIAEAAAITMTQAGHNEEIYNLVGPDELTGEETARIWGRVLGRSVAYAGDDLDAWEEQSLAYLPPWMVFDFREMYAFFQEEGLKATPDDIARQTKLLGHPPRRFEDYASETARGWTAETSGVGAGRR
jgi:uncharacterized protein YbjT (DUF2867 family)